MIYARGFPNKLFHSSLIALIEISQIFLSSIEWRRKKKKISMFGMFFFPPRSANMGELAGLPTHIPRGKDPLALRQSCLIRHYTVQPRKNETENYRGFIIT